MDIPDRQFYDKVATKFGSYKGKERYTSRFSNRDPEEFFLKQLIEYANKNKVALDIGCADGRFTLKVSKYFRQILAIDISSQMLKAAKRFQTDQKGSNVVFQEADAEKLPFQDKYFDLIYSRRGPSPYAEISRVIKQGGYYLEICIGEKDAKELKEVFVRGQGFGEWDISVAETKSNNLKKLGFKTIFVHDYFYSDIYPDVENFDLFLQGVPIFKDFDSEKDKEFVLSYVQKMKVANGIKLKRHRVVIVAEKL